MMVDYDARWPLMFEQEKERILTAAGEKVIGMEHIGSTAVPGLGAKPIIDILATVRSLDNVKELIQPLRSIGYEYCRENDSLLPDSRLFHKGPSNARTHNLRIVEEGSRLCEEYILFRNYLRDHPEVAHEYYELKRRLYKEQGYILSADSKTSFIESVVKRARLE